jgi:hypothetical protein
LVQPAPGDIFLLKTLKPFSAWDVFEFTTNTSGISQSDLDRFPLEIKLFQNYPNPFNPKTAIGYRLSAVSDVELSIYNLLGQKIKTLVSERQPAGEYQIEWNAVNLASGVYYYQLIAGEFRSVKKMILMR